VLGLAVLIACVAAVRAWQSPPHYSHASLRLSYDIHDLGHTALQQEWRVPFQIRNFGTRRLVINEIDLECGCRDPIRRTILVPPGETVEANVTLDTRFAAGPIEKTASFTTSDPTHPRFELTVRAWVDAAETTPHPRSPDLNEASILISQ
jgi:hypothetical protein